jgi:EAL domain-containing protein (putative c-di-GMP-specific phosphodiesterase class I)
VDQLGPAPSLERHRAEIHALARDIVPALQPIVDLKTGRPVGVEALARFRSGPADSPGPWFLKAWDVGVGLDFELAAARAALSSVQRIPADWYLAINFSARAILAPEFDALIRPFATRVVVELTEHSQVQDYDGLEAALRPLRRRGLRLSVDDVGAGFSSFARILHLKPDIVKLDSFLTRGVQRDRVRAALLRGLVAFTRTMRADLVAEGIENAIEQEALVGLGITFGQGYHLGAPRIWNSPVDAASILRGLPDVPRPSC